MVFGCADELLINMLSCEPVIEEARSAMAAGGFQNLVVIFGESL